MNKKMVDYHLDDEEKQILKDVEAGKYVQIDNFEAEKKRLQKIAAYTLKQMKKNKNINIRINEQTLKTFKKQAAREGLPYQTLAASVLHKYAHGMLKPA